MVLEKVKAILAEQFDVEEDKITADTDLQEDLGADSLDVVDLLMSIEDEFEVEVPDEEIENIKTVGSLVSYIEANCFFALNFWEVVFTASFCFAQKGWKFADLVYIEKVENLKIQAVSKRLKNKRISV